eukprot:scaffold5377_cov113-Skeletonema_dohrnii-CCMP3373.AAC.1
MPLLLLLSPTSLASARSSLVNNIVAAERAEAVGAPLLKYLPSSLSSIFYLRLSELAMKMKILWIVMRRWHFCQ